MTKSKQNSDIFTDVEYCDIILNGKTLHTFPGNEVNGKKKYEFQKLIGEIVGVETYNASMKYIGVFTNKTFRIKGIKLGKNEMSKQTETEKSEFSKFEDLLKRYTSNPNSDQMFQAIQMQKMIYDQQIVTLNGTVTRLENKVSNLESENKTLQQENFSLKLKIEKLENEEDSSGGLLGTLLQLAQLKGGGKNIGTTLTGIKSDTSNIPPIFLEALGKIDYDQLGEEEVNKFVMIFNQFAHNLPLKKENES